MDIYLNIPSTSLRYGRRFIITSRSCRSFPPSFRLGVNQNIDPSLRLRPGGLTNRHRFATGAISSNESLPAASPFLPLRFVSGGLTSRRRFASLRSGRRPLNGGILTGVITLRTVVTLFVTRRYLKDKFTASFPRQSYSCFVSISFSDGACPLPPPN